jgi:spermidine/putrescine transport system ATP-binding protein
LRAIAGFVTPSGGQILVEGRNIVSDPPERRPVNTVFQNYALFPHLTVEKNIAFGLEVSRVPRAEIAQRVARAVTLVQLEGLERRNVDELSGGQKQRVALARSVINEPKVLLLDEPLGALDLKLRHEMQFELRTLQRTLGLTFVYVTHDQEEALVLSDRVAVMRNGALSQVGTPEQVYREPESRFVAEFVGETNLIPGTAVNGVVQMRDIPILISAPDAADGPALISIRPQHVEIALAGDDNLQGQIVDSVFLGADVRLTIEVHNSTLQLVSVMRSTGRHVPAVGERVAITWNPEYCRVIRDDE